MTEAAVWRDANLPAIQALTNAWEALQAPTEADRPQRKVVVITGPSGIGKTAAVQGFYDDIFAPTTSWQTYRFGVGQPDRVNELRDLSLAELDSTRRNLRPPGLQRGKLRLAPDDPVWLPLRCAPDFGDSESGQLDALLRQVYELGPRPPRWRTVIGVLLLLSGMAGLATSSLPDWLGYALIGIGVAGWVLFEPLPLLQRIRNALWQAFRLASDWVHQWIRRVGNRLKLKSVQIPALEQKLFDQVGELLELLDRSGPKEDSPLCLVVDDLHLAQPETELFLRYVLDLLPYDFEGHEHQPDERLRRRVRRIRHPILLVLLASTSDKRDLKAEPLVAFRSFAQRSGSVVEMDGLDRRGAKALYLAALPALRAAHLEPLVELLLDKSRVAAHPDNPVSVMDIVRDVRSVGYSTWQRFNPYSLLQNVQYLARVGVSEAAIRKAINKGYVVRLPLEIYQQQYRDFDRDAAAVVSAAAGLLPDASSSLPVDVLRGLIGVNVGNGVPALVGAGWLTKRNLGGREWVGFADDGYQAVAKARPHEEVDREKAVDLFVPLLGESDMAIFYAEHHVHSEWDRKAAAKALLSMSQSNARAAMTLGRRDLFIQLSRSERRQVVEWLLRLSKTHGSAAKAVYDLWEELGVGQRKELMEHLLLLVKSDRWALRTVTRPRRLLRRLSEEDQREFARRVLHYSEVRELATLLAIHLVRRLSEEDQREFARRLLHYSRLHKWAATLVTVHLHRRLSEEDQRELARRMFRYSKTEVSAATTLAAHLHRRLSEEDQRELARRLFRYSETEVSAATTLAAHLYRRLSEEDQQKLAQGLLVYSNVYFSATRALKIHMPNALSHEKERLLTLEETAAYLRLTPGALYTQWDRRDKPGVLGIRVGGRVLFRLSDIDRFLDERRSQSELDRDR